MTWRTKVFRVFAVVALLAGFSLATGADFIDFARWLYSFVW